MRGLWLQPLANLLLSDLLQKWFARKLKQEKKAHRVMGDDG